MFGAQAVIAYGVPRLSTDVDVTLHDDVRALWRLHGRDVHAERIRSTLQLLEEALSQSDLLASFESIVRRE